MRGVGIPTASQVITTTSPMVTVIGVAGGRVTVGEAVKMMKENDKV